MPTAYIVFPLEKIINVEEMIGYMMKILIFTTKNDYILKRVVFL